MRQTLPVLLAHALAEFEARFNVLAKGRVTMVVWSNVLRVLRAGPLSVKAFPAAAVLSKRVVRVATRHAEADGLVRLEDRAVVLTDAGEAARAAGQAAVDAVGGSWGQRLLPHLRAVVADVDIELPHYPTGYGQGDSSFTGGDFVPAEAGPPRVPAHGQEWPVVLRDRGAIDELSIGALLGQALVAFTIDYDTTSQGVFGGLNNAIRFFQYLPDAGIPLAEARSSGGVTGTGRSNFERHRLVVVREGRVFPTARGLVIREAYPVRAFDVEDAWRTRLSARVVDGLRGELEALRIVGRPDFPDTNGWLRPTRTRRPDKS